MTYAIGPGRRKLGINLPKAKLSCSKKDNMPSIDWTHMKSLPKITNQNILIIIYIILFYRFSSDTYVHGNLCKLNTSESKKNCFVAWNFYYYYEGLKFHELFNLLQIQILCTCNIFALFLTCTKCFLNCSNKFHQMIFVDINDFRL